MLRVDDAHLNEKTRLLDFGPILTPAASLAPGEPQASPPPPPPPPPERPPPEPPPQNPTPPVFLLRL